MGVNGAQQRSRAGAYGAGGRDRRVVGDAPREGRAGGWVAGVLFGLCSGGGLAVTQMVARWAADCRAAGRESARGCETAKMGDGRVGQRGARGLFGWDGGR